jgi:hypothetical protein
VAPFTKAPKHGDSVCFRQTEVENNDVGPAKCNFRKALLAALRFEDAVPARVKDQTQKAADLDLVVDN